MAVNTPSYLLGSTFEPNWRKSKRLCSGKRVVWRQRKCLWMVIEMWTASAVKKRKGGGTGRIRKRDGRLRRAGIFPRLRLSIRLPRHRSTCYRWVRLRHRLLAPRRSCLICHWTCHQHQHLVLKWRVRQRWQRKLFLVTLASRSMVLPLLRCLLRKYIPEKPKERRLMVSHLWRNRPQRAKDKDGKTKNKKNKIFEEDTGSFSFVVPVYRHGRSASAPTPPDQSIQLPNVYHVTPSCPTSPSLLPMISRRSAHPGHPEDVMSSFDYLPNSFVQPSFPLLGQFEANLQVPGILMIWNVISNKIHTLTITDQTLAKAGFLVINTILRKRRSRTRYEWSTEVY